MWTYIQEQSELERHIPLIMSKQSWGFDTETTGLDPIRDRVNLVQIGDTEHQFIIDSRKVNLGPLKSFFEDKTHYLYGHNLKYDYKMMKTSFGIECERLRCTYLIEKILTAGKKFSGFSLGDLVKFYLNVEMDKSLQKSFINHVGDFSREQLEYAANDIKYMIPLKKKMLEISSNLGLDNTVFLECEAIPVFGDMEIQGIPLDSKNWLKIRDDNLKRAEEIKAELDEIAISVGARADLFGNCEVNWSSPDQVVKVLRMLGVRIKEVDSQGKITEKLIEKSDDKTLKKVKNCKAVQLLKTYRSYMVKVNTFGQPFVDALHPDTGRIHPDFAQIGTETGRIAARDGEKGRIVVNNKKLANVNLLNIPSRGAEAKMMRNCFIAPEDYVVETDDYSGCELRIWAHISQDPGLCEALRKGLDLHCHVATKLYGKTVSKTENAALRTPAKSLNFGKPERWAA